MCMWFGLVCGGGRKEWWERDQWFPIRIPEEIEKGREWMVDQFFRPVKMEKLGSVGREKSKDSSPGTLQEKNDELIAFLEDE